MFHFKLCFYCANKDMKIEIAETEIMIYSSFLKSLIQKNHFSLFENALNIQNPTLKKAPNVKVNTQACR